MRQVVLHVHLSQAAPTGQPEGCVGRVENRQSLVTAEQVRTWCGSPDAQVRVNPVLGLSERLATTAYEVPDEMALEADLGDRACVFPFCGRPARGLDHDHVEPWPEGPTATGNIAPLCRMHHRLKTHGRWAFTALEPGVYLWRSPHGYAWLRDHTGTRDVTAGQVGARGVTPRDTARQTNRSHADPPDQ